MIKSGGIYVSKIGFNTWGDDSFGRFAFCLENGDFFVVLDICSALARDDNWTSDAYCVILTSRGIVRTPRFCNISALEKFI